ENAPRRQVLPDHGESSKQTVDHLPVGVLKIFMVGGGTVVITKEVEAKGKSVVKRELHRFRSTRGILPGNGDRQVGRILLYKQSADSLFHKMERRFSGHCGPLGVVVTTHAVEGDHNAHARVF